MSVGSFAQGAPATVNRLIELGKNDNRAADIHRELCKTFGARRTGSQALAQAQRWAMRELTRFGWQNVRLEKWGEVPVGFERGPNRHARMVSPYASDIKFSSAAWTAGTRGPIQAQVVLQPTTMEDFEKIKDSIVGKWVLMARPVGMGSSRRPRPLSEADKQADPAAAELERVDNAMDKIAIAGRIYGGSDKRNLIHTHGTWTGLTWQTVPTDVRVNISMSDARTLRRLAEAGQAPVVEFNVDQRFLPEPVPQYNVVAELPGSDKKDELVIIGAHFDSWDSPGSEGASDNGSGSAIQLEAARMLAKSGAKPRRTIRLVLFSGEEQGLLGSLGDVKNLGDRLKKVSVMINEDSGSNFQTQVSGLKQWQAPVERALSDFNRAFPDRAIKFAPVDRPWMRGGGSDHAAYLQAGIPAFMWGKAGPQSYSYIWHTQNDTVENAFADGLRQMAINHALLAYNLACAEEMLYRPDKLPTVSDIVGPNVGGAPDDHDHDHDH
jgi:hypothetical protein